MTGKRYSVNMKPPKKKPTQKKPNDNIASSGQDQNAVIAEQSLAANSRVNGEPASHHDGGIPYAQSGNQTGESILQHLREQDKQIDRLSNTVDELRKTMAEMNGTLAKLREENQQSRPPVQDTSSGDRFDIVASVLREIRSKDGEVERLKLKNDVLALKLRYLEEKHSDNSTEGDCVDENVEGSNARSMKVPLKEPDEGAAPNPTPSHSNSREQHQCPEVQVPVPGARNRQTKRRSTSNAGTGTTTTEKEQPAIKPPAKKPRRSSSKTSAPNKPTLNQQEPAKRGRPLSTTNAPKPTDEPQTKENTNEKDENAAQPVLPLRHVASSSSTSNLSTASTAKETDNPDPNSTGEPGTQRRRSARSLTRRSRRPSLSPSSHPSQVVIPPSDASASAGDVPSSNEPFLKESQEQQERLRKEQIAARDRLVEFAMRREEAMEMAEGVGHDN